MSRSPRRHESIRMSVPVPVEAHEAFQELADTVNASLGATIAEWLLDAAPVVREMASQLKQLKGNHRLVASEVHALASSVEEATRHVLERVQSGARTAEGAPLAGVGRRAEKTLTPPSSNTGGKVPQKTKKTHSRGPR